MKERISSQRYLLLTMVLASSVAWSLGQARGDASASNGHSVNRAADIHSGRDNSGSTTAKSNANSDGQRSGIQGGRCTLAGSWKQTAENVGASIWEIDGTGKANESGLGGATGTATLTGNKLRIDWKTSNGFWSGYYEWQLDSGCNSGEGELVFQSGASGTRKSTVARQDVNSAPPAQPALPAPSPAPIPPVDSGSSKGMSKFVNEPDHSPDKLDFGEVWEGQSYTRSFRLTANASGNVVVSIPPGLFRLTEIRELGPEHMTGKGTGPMPKGPIGPIRDLKRKVSFEPDNTGPWTGSADAGDQLQIYVVFAPKVLFDPGEKTAAMKVSGPGPVGNWVLAVPLRGVSRAEQPKTQTEGSAKLENIITKVRITVVTGSDDLREGSSLRAFLDLRDGTRLISAYLNCNGHPVAWDQFHDACEGLSEGTLHTFAWNMEVNVHPSDVHRFGLSFESHSDPFTQTGDNWNLDKLEVEYAGTGGTYLMYKASGHPLYRFKTKEEWMTEPLNLKD